jgi:effector-binding domain-containing protein
MFDVVYSWLKVAPVKQAGHNFALYERGAKRDLLVRVGFPVSSVFEDTDSVKCFELAAGRAAHAVHVGPYSELHRTYAELETWCKQERVPLSGHSWEVYGDWNKDESKLETEIYLRIR